ncbi:TatD family hydrolase [Patescibacteria group bacterium]|nr:TatD family hydrolase [Patescibacteria group bacterium]
MIIDTHAHLHFAQFREDLPQVINNACNNGLTAVINIGSDLKTSQKAVELQSDHITFFATIGLHPHEANNFSSSVSIHQSIGKLAQLYQNNTGKIIGIGECGLDYFFQQNPGFTPLALSETQITKLQKELFQAQIDFAKKLKLPLVIHCRDAWQDIFDFNYQGVTGVFHSFTADLEIARKALNLGFDLGFSCIVTYPKNERLLEVIKYMPADKILAETDCPFLPPQGKRGQRNEPANVVEVVKTISQIKNQSIQEIAQITYQNAQRLFSLGNS